MEGGIQRSKYQHLKTHRDGTQADSREEKNESRKTRHKFEDVSRVVNVIPTAHIVWERCLGLFTHRLVSARFMHACSVAITLLRDEQIHLAVGIIFPMPQFRKRIHRRIFHLRVAGIILGRKFRSNTLVSIGLCSFCSFLLQAFRSGFCGSLARHGCFLATSLHFCIRFRFQVLIWKSNAFVLSSSTRTARVRSSRIAQISDDTFSLSHTCRFDSGRCGCVCHHHVLKSFLAFRGVSLSRYRQFGAVNCWVTKLFKVCFTDVDVAGSSVVAVVSFGWCGFNIKQLRGTLSARESELLPIGFLSAL